MRRSIHRRKKTRHGMLAVQPIHPTGVYKSADAAAALGIDIGDLAAHVKARNLASPARLGTRKVYLGKWLIEFVEKLAKADGAKKKGATHAR